MTTEPSQRNNSGYSFTTDHEKGQTELYLYGYRLRFLPDNDFRFHEITPKIQGSYKERTIGSIVPVVVTHHDGTNVAFVSRAAGEVTYSNKRGQYQDGAHFKDGSSQTISFHERFFQTTLKTEDLKLIQAALEMRLIAPNLYDIDRVQDLSFIDATPSGLKALGLATNGEVARRPAKAGHGRTWGFIEPGAFGGT